MPKETIEGVVEDIIFYNAESGYTVLSLHPNGKHTLTDQIDDEVVVVGKLVELQPGETVRFTGTWTVHKDYGQQFRAEAMHLVTTTSDSVQRYLANGLIDGVSKQTAKQILDHFGANAMEVLDNSPSRINEVPGLTAKRAKQIANSWADQRRSRKVMLFLQNYGITAGLAHKIYEASGTLFALSQLSMDGHIYAPRPTLVEKTSEILGVPAELAESAITKLAKTQQLISLKHKNGPSGNIEILYLPAMYQNEIDVSEKLRAMVNAKTSALKSGKAKKAKDIDWPAFFEKMARTSKVTLTEQQQDAVRAALNNKLVVLTGGPGTGKTTTLRAVIGALDSIKAEYVLASPTGLHAGPGTLCASARSDDRKNAPDACRGC